MTDRTDALTEMAAPVRPLDGHYTDWPAILAGAVIASALALVFSTFGAAIGLASISPYDGPGNVITYVLAGTSWMLWTSVSSFMVGGYVAGRMRRRIDNSTAHEVAVRDGIHGLTVWGFGILAGLMLAGFVATAGPEALQLAAASNGAVGTTGLTLSAAETAQLEVTAQRYGVISALAVAASLLVSAVGAYWAAGKGGEHRDEAREFARFGSWK